MKIVERDLSELEPFEKNPKKHPGSQIKLLVRSIEEFGFTSPILTVEHNGKHLVVAGHARLKAAIAKGLKTVPTIDLGLPYEKAVAYNLADNKLAELADWDLKLVRLLMKDEIPKELWDVTGFDHLLEEEEPPFEEPKVSVSRCKLGQVWGLGSHRLMCGDATKVEDVSKLMGSEKGDMIFTDPPYGVSYSELVKSYGGSTKWADIKNDDLRAVELEEFNEKFIRNIVAFSKLPFSAYICCGSRRLHHILNVLDRLGIYFPVPLCWKKRSIMISWQRYHPDYEMIVFCGDGAHPTGKQSVWYGPNNEATTWEISRETTKDYLHPTQKPLELINRAIRNSSQPGDIVLDLFGGSGSTLIACQQLDRQCRMMELDPHYCEVIMQRWEKYTGKQAELIEDAN